jgi:hypothetical protein
VYAVVFAAKVLVGDGFHDVWVKATDVLVGAPLGEGGDPDAVEDGLQDFGEVLVGNVNDGEAWLVVLVEIKISIERDSFEVAFLEKEGDGTEGFEGGLPVCSAMPWWRGGFGETQCFLVGVGAMVVGIAALPHDFGDHVSVLGPLVPESSEAVKPLGELDEVWIHVTGVGGGEGETYPRGTSA